MGEMGWGGGVLKRGGGRGGGCILTQNNVADRLPLEESAGDSSEENLGRPVGGGEGGPGGVRAGSGLGKDGVRVG